MPRKLKIEIPEKLLPIRQPARYKVLYGGRGSAKSWTVARELIKRACTSNVLILCTRELQKSIKQSVHRLIKSQINYLGVSDLFEITDTVIRCPSTGSEFIFWGARFNTDEIKSTEGIDICWIEEAHNLTEDSWDLIDPTVRKPGSEIWVTFNPRFRYDHVYRMFVVDDPPPDSWVVEVNYEDNPWFDDTEMPKQRDEMYSKDYEKYLNIWKGQTKQLATGAIFGKQVTEIKKHNRLTYVPIQKSCEVHTFNDIGKNDPCAWWFMQQTGQQYRFIDYYENRFEDIDHYVRVLKAMGYDYGKHWMPHDADHERMGMTRNIKQQFLDGGVRPIEIVPRVKDKNIGIQQARDVMGSCWFHFDEEDQKEVYIEWLPDGWRTRAQRMEHGWERLCNYRYKYNDDDGVFQQKPHHDRASNGADAFMQFAQSYEEEKSDWDTPIDVEPEIL